MAKQPPMTRQQSLDAKPLAVPIVERQEMPDGAARLVVGVASSRWHQLVLRMPSVVHRKYELDAMGLEVLAMCDGRTTVRHMIRAFARAHRIDEVEAERSVLSFLRTMVRKGLVLIVVK